MRFAGFIGLLVLAAVFLTSCGGVHNADASVSASNSSAVSSPVSSIAAGSSAIDNVAVVSSYTDNVAAVSPAIDSVAEVSSDAESIAEATSAGGSTEEDSGSTDTAVVSDEQSLTDGEGAGLGKPVFKLDTIYDQKLVEIGGRPYGLAFGKDGAMYAARERNEVVKITPDGKVSSFFKTDDSNAKPGVTRIWNIVAGPDGNLYMPAEDRLFRVSPGGKAETLIHDPEVFPEGVTFDKGNNMYVTSGLKVFKYTPALEKSVFIDCGKSVSGMIFMDPRFDSGFRNLYVTNYAYQEVYRFPIESDGSAGDKNIIFSTSEFNTALYDLNPSWAPSAGAAHATWFAADDSGELYISVEDIGVIMKLNKDNQYTLYQIDDHFFNSTISFGGEGFEKASIYTTGYDDGFIHKLSFKE